MFDHVKIGVSDYAASKAFFLQGARTARGSRCIGRNADVRYRALPPGRNGFILPVPVRREAGSSSPGVRRGESRTSRSLLSRGPGGGRQGQRRAWAAPELQRDLLRGFRHWSGRAQHRSGLPRGRGLTNR